MFRETEEDMNSSTDSETQNRSEFNKKRLRSKNKRYKKMHQNLLKIEKSRNKASRQELKIRESNVSDSIVLPKELTHKPMFQNFKPMRKKYLRGDNARDAAITQLRKSKELHSINMSDDNFLECKQGFKSKMSSQIDVRTDAINKSLSIPEKEDGSNSIIPQSDSVLEVP